MKEKLDIIIKYIRALFLLDFGILKLNFTFAQNAKKIPVKKDNNVDTVVFIPKLIIYDRRINSSSKDITPKIMYSPRNLKR